ncbi:hypothetical protein AAEO56_08235 [Flavobacterium sp. DGU11]|uniref:Uncharacterized protein n=1 Tax=Flavobacterium arundinis TaxID=3139143 RepID=A0ABU9HVU4_9FLAO
MKQLLTALILILLFSCKSKMPVPDATLPENPEAVTEETTVTTENVMKADLYLPGDENINFNEVYRNNDSILASKLKIEIINQQMFESSQKTAVNFWVEDTAGATKIDSVLTVKARDSILTFVDDTTDTETHKTFSYEGKLPVINQFIVLGTYYEDYGYMLIDMTTGRDTETYQAFPLISPDKKFIVSLYANIYAPESGDLSVDSIDNGAIVPLFIVSFKNWMPQESFYGSDGWLYVSVNHPKEYWSPDGEVNDEHQYIRIKVF